MPRIKSPFRNFGIADDVDYAPIPWRGGRFDPEALTEAVETQERAQHALEVWDAARIPGRWPERVCRLIQQSDYRRYQARAGDPVEGRSPCGSPRQPLCIQRGRGRLRAWQGQLGYEQQLMGPPGGFGGGPPARHGHGHVLEPMGEHADRGGNRRQARFERVHTVLQCGYRQFRVALADLLDHQYTSPGRNPARRDHGVRRFHHSTGGARLGRAKRPLPGPREEPASPPPGRFG